MSTQLAGWASMVRTAKMSVPRRETGDLRGVLRASGKVKKGHFDGHARTFSALYKHYAIVTVAVLLMNESTARFGWY